MIRGIVTESLAPMVPLSLQGEEGQTKIQAIFDGQKEEAKAGSEISNLS